MEKVRAGTKVTDELLRKAELAWTLLGHSFLRDPRGPAEYFRIERP